MFTTPHYLLPKPNVFFYFKHVKYSLTSTERLQILTDAVKEMQDLLMKKDRYIKEHDEIFEKMKTNVKL